MEWERCVSSQIAFTKSTSDWQISLLQGWGDALAFATEQTSATIGPFTLGSYVLQLHIGTMHELTPFRRWVYNNPKGIRSVPYSTDKSIDPYMYSRLKTISEGMLTHNCSKLYSLKNFLQSTKLVKYGLPSLLKVRCLAY